MALLNEINVKGVPHPIVTDDGYYQEMTVGDAEQLVATTFTEDDAPYNFRTAGGAIDIGDRKQVEGIVGGTVAWNQLVQNGNFANTNNWSGQYCSISASGNVLTAEATAENVAGRIEQEVTLIAGHKYLFKENIKVSANATSRFAYRYSGGIKYTASLNATANTWGELATVFSAATQGDSGMLYLYYSNSTALAVGGTAQYKNVMLIDLTQMFGSTIADYIYSLEQATAGAGVAWFKKLFPKPYYAYNAGELMSVKALRHITRGFNAWDEEWEVGGFETNGSTNSSQDRIRSKNYIPCVPNQGYYFKQGSLAWNEWSYFLFYDADKTLIGERITVRGTFTTPNNACYMKFNTNNLYGNTYHHDICINLHWDGERDGEYEEYVEHVYELDPDLELRGIPKLSAGNDLYYDGDIYEPDGTVTRRSEEISISISNIYVRETNATCDFALFVVPTAWAVASDGYPDTIGEKTIRNSSTWDYITTTGAIVVYQTSNRTLAIAVPKGTTLAQAKTMFDGSKFLYLVATPTEETADPYNGVQIVDDFGTEEFVDAGVAAETRDVAIPVGHNSLYQPNLRAKLEMAPESPEDEGYYVVYHHNGINEYVPLIIPQELPNLPSEDGTYILKCTVASGSATLSFESEV